MADKFLEQDGIEVGYWGKRKKQFTDEISKGISSVGVKAKVQDKKTFKTNSKKDLGQAPKPKESNEKSTV